MTPDEREQLIKRILGDVPYVKFARREASTPEEAKRWKEEGVIVNPSSLDFVVNEARRLHAEAKKAVDPKNSGAATKS